MAVVSQSVSAEKLIKELRRAGLKSEADAGAEDDAGAGDGDFDWNRLGRAVGGFFASVPPVEFLRGPIRWFIQTFFFLYT